LPTRKQQIYRNRK